MRERDEATAVIRPCPGIGRAVLAAALLAAAAALLEAASQLLRFGTATAPLAGGWAALLTAPLLPAGLAAACLAAAAYLPAGLLRARRDGARAALAAAASLAVLATLAASYLLREHGPRWWEGEGSPWPRRLVMLAVWTGVTLLLERLLREWWRRGRCRPRAATAAALLLLLAGVLGWRSQLSAWRAERLAGTPLGEAPAGAPDLVLVTIDTWRADYDRLLGPGNPPTPNLDRFAAEAVRLRDAWSSGSWTLPSMATLLTGWPPRTLGVARYRGLPDGVTTLAQLARRAGYDTWAVAANPYLTPSYGFARGFARYDHARQLEWLLPAARSVLVREVTARWQQRWSRDDAAAQIGKAVRWLARRRGDRPCFLWIHLMDPHVPYRRHTPDDFPAAARRAGTVWCAPPPPDSPLFTADGFPAGRMPAVRELCPDVPDSVATALQSLYAGEVAYTDAWLGVLFDALRGSGSWDRSLVVLAADHGEEFFEHGGYEHGHSLLPEVTRIPLLVKLPGGEGAGLAVDADRRTLDLVPSLCAELGWPVPEGLPGRPGLWAEASAGPAGASPPAIMENMLYGPPRLGLRLERWLRITVPATGDSVWYDLGSDPAAQAPLASRPDGVDPLLRAARRRLAAWDSLAAVLQPDGEDTTTTVIDPQLQRQLRSLGY